MSWTTPKTWAAGDVLSASDLNTYVRDNANALLARPADGIVYDNGANYTSTSDTFVAIDGTNLSIALTIAGTKICFGFAGVMVDGTAGSTDFDVTVDGTRVGNAGANGLCYYVSGRAPSVSFGGIAKGLSTGAHTIQVVWKRHSAGSGTCALCSGNGTGGQDFVPSFWAYEVG